MANFLRVTNWESLQHYKDRTPPWIKLHNELLESYEFECLPDASKAHLLCIWLLASRTNNKINADPRWIARKIGANSPVDIDVLVNAGFLQVIQEVTQSEHNASKMLQKAEQDAIPEREGEGERERETEKREKRSLSAKADSGSVKEVFEHWRSVMGKSSNAALNEKRSKAIKGRLAEGYSVDYIKTAILGCSLTPHNMGRNDNGKRYDDIELICRNGCNLERFANNASHQHQPVRLCGEAAEKTMNNLANLELR
jgi:hypothetical protein